MNTTADTYDVIIAGAGPAGTSAAIHLANHDVRVLLLEQKKFPRAKLCGEFISPECLKHFVRLGVNAEMMLAGPAVLTETVFYARSGRRLTVPSRWFGGGALGLSRAVMDHNLMERARDAGVEVRENASVTELIKENACVHGVRVKSDGRDREYFAPVTIDATGRTRALSRKLEGLRQHTPPRSKPKLVAFKAHLANTKVEQGACEIYFYPGGYGGLSTVEGGLSNLCFITAAKDVRRCHSDASAVMSETVLRNRRAAHALQDSCVSSEWLSVALEGFGRQWPSPINGLLAIGDSAAFIDPFTGSGMLMALESGELACRVIVRHLKTLRKNTSLNALTHDYVKEYRKRFDSRLRTCAVLRRAVFAPRVAEMGIVVCSASEWLRNRLARATRSGGSSDQSLLGSVE